MLTSLPSSAHLSCSLQYGGQIVPLVKEAELVMKYAPEKSFQVLGTVARKSTPHSMFVGVRLQAGKQTNRRPSRCKP